MIGVKINDDGCDDIAFILKGDLVRGHPTIYLGGNMEELDYSLLYGDRKQIAPRMSFSMTPNTALYERDIEHIITHESTHIAIYEVTKNIRAATMLDNIDHPEKHLLTVGAER